MSEKAGKPGGKPSGTGSGFAGLGLTRRQVLAGIAVPGLVVGAYGGLIEPLAFMNVTRYAPRLPNWPDGLKLRIALIADPHLNNPFMPGKLFRRFIRRTNELKPDIVMLLGDYAPGHPFILREYSVRAVAALMSEFTAPLGTYAVMGNHDWWHDTYGPTTRKGPLRQHLEFRKKGIVALENEAVRIEKDGQPFWIAGLGDQHAFPDGKGGFTGIDDLPATTAVITDDAPAILMAHEPDIFTRVPDRFALTVCGHTHGGQITLAGYAPVVPSKYGQRFRYGHIVEEGRHLIVSGGIGCTGIPVRIGVPPEIVLVELGGV
ncbi:MAG: metallophosphoesterase [Geminicoccaceae bacterium]